MNWRNIQIVGIASVDKLVAEFQVWELNKTPYGKFKVRVYEKKDGNFVGYTNIQLKPLDDECPESGVGYGATVDEALNDTINYFMNMINLREDLSEEDFDWSDPHDF